MCALPNNGSNWELCSARSRVVHSFYYLIYIYLNLIALMNLANQQNAFAPHNSFSFPIIYDVFFFFSYFWFGFVVGVLYIVVPTICIRPLFFLLFASIIVITMPVNFDYFVVL